MAEQVSQFAESIKTLPRGGVLPEVEVQFFSKDDAPDACLAVPDADGLRACLLIYGDSGLDPQNRGTIDAFLSQAVRHAAVICTPHLDIKRYPWHEWRWDLAGVIPAAAALPVDGHRPQSAVRYVRYGLRNTQPRQYEAIRSTSPA